MCLSIIKRFALSTRKSVKTPKIEPQIIRGKPKILQDGSEVIVFKIGKNDNAHVPRKMIQKLKGKLLPFLPKKILNWIEKDKISAPIHNPKVKSSIPIQREIPNPLAIPTAQIGPHIQIKFLIFNFQTLKSILYCFKRFVNKNLFALLVRTLFLISFEIKKDV